MSSGRLELSHGATCTSETPKFAARACRGQTRDPHTHTSMSAAGNGATAGGTLPPWNATHTPPADTPQICTPYARQPGGTQHGAGRRCGEPAEQTPGGLLAIGTVPVRWKPPHTPCPTPSGPTRAWTPPPTTLACHLAHRVRSSCRISPAVCSPCPHQPCLLFGCLPRDIACGRAP